MPRNKIIYWDLCFQILRTKLLYLLKLFGIYSFFFECFLLSPTSVNIYFEFDYKLFDFTNNLKEILINSKTVPGLIGIQSKSICIFVY